MRLILILLHLGLFFGSCSTLNTVIEDKEAGGGTTEAYDVSYDDAWVIAKKSYRWAGSDAIEEYKVEGYMLTSKGQNLVSSGSVMGTWIKDLGNNKCEVTCVSKRRIQTQWATGMTESKYHKYFAKGLEIMKSGEELPMTAPEV